MGVVAGFCLANTFVIAAGYCLADTLEMVQGFWLALTVEASGGYWLAVPGAWSRVSAWRSPGCCDRQTTPNAVLPLPLQAPP